MLFVPFNVPPVTDIDLVYVSKTIERGRISGNGSYSVWTEQLLGEVLGASGVLLTSSCTHALEMSCFLLDLQLGDEVIVPSYTFVSIANAVALAGGTPVFADVLETTLNLDLASIKPLVNERTRAVVVVHYGGVSVDMDPLLDFCAKREIKIIEDNAHGIFGSYKGRSLGTLGCLGTLSFHETKNVSCGEGGALVVNESEFYERAEIIREKGTNRRQFLLGKVDKYTWVDIGSSWALSEILSSILYSQIERREELISSRTSAYMKYETLLSGWARENDVKTPVIPPFAKSSYHCFHIRFSNEDIRTKFIRHCDERGVNTVFHYQALNLSPMGIKLGGREGQCPVAEQASKCLVRLPLFSGMTAQQSDQVIESVLSFPF